MASLWFTQHERAFQQPVKAFDQHDNFALGQFAKIGNQAMAVLAVLNIRVHNLQIADLASAALRAAPFDKHSCLPGHG